MEYPHTKRFMLVWRHRKLVKEVKKEVYPYYSLRYKNGYIEKTYVNFSKEPMQESITEYDTEKELLADLDLIGQLKSEEELSEYICLDFEREKVFKFNVYDRYNSYREDYHNNYSSLFAFLNLIKLTDKVCGKIDPNSPYSRDILFRKDNEIPKNYKWDEGEYEGWLQYRWGDGKNAIKKDDTKKVKNKKISKSIDENNIEDLIQENYDKKLSKEKIIYKFDRW